MEWLSDIYAFANSNFFTTIIGSTIGASITFYFVNRRDRKTLEKRTLAILPLIINELERNRDRLLHAKSDTEIIPEITSWNIYKLDINEVYQDIYYEYIIWLNSFIDAKKTTYYTGIHLPGTLNEQYSISYNLSLIHI